MTYQWYWPDQNAYSWDFDLWRERYGIEPIESSQSGLRAPAPLLGEATTLEQWRSESVPYWRSVSMRLLGRLRDQPPADAAPEPVGPRFETASYTMQRHRYQLTDDEFGYGWLLVPHEPLFTDAAILALHPTACNGKDQIVGLDETSVSTNGGPYARELAERGFVVFAPDAITFGERQMGHRHARYRSAWEFFDAHPEGSVMAKMAYDTSRALDALETLGYRRFASIGHSHGAYGTLFAMLEDPRIVGGVMSCGINLLRDDPAPERWWRATALIPRLGLGEESSVLAPLDFHHWLALVAPRPIMVIGGTEDKIFPNVAPLASRLEEVRQVYALHGASDALVSEVGPGGHVFTPEARERAGRMLSAVLA